MRQAGAQAVEEIRQLIARATAVRAARMEKSQAFGEIVRRFQDLAFACAYALLGDFHMAEDVAQESFLTAWRNLEQLRQPEAFPGWLKRIILTHCSRATRGKQLPTVLLDRVAELPALDCDPQASYEASEHRARVLAAIQELPEHERMATLLFYINDYSQSEIAAFLEVPLTTVKKRLFSARRKLRERMLDMVRETLQEQRPSRNEQFAETVALFNEALEVLEQALALINSYNDRRLELLFGPILGYLSQEGGVRTSSELDYYIKKQVQSHSLCNIYEWLADKGIIQKVPSPLRLTQKSQIEVDEAAYYYDGAAQPID